TADAALGALSFTDATFRAEAKGITDGITTSASTLGPLHSMPVSMVLTIEDFGYVPIFSDIVWYAYPDYGISGFGVVPSRPTVSFLSFDLVGYDLTTSEDTGPVNGIMGTATSLLTTPYGLLSVFNAELEGSRFTATVFDNPAPGGATVFALAGGVLACRRRRSENPRTNMWQTGQTLTTSRLHVREV
ncbi:MAG: hypothetical protein ACTS27_10460, partial [Phycisphaerales bacterium]